MRLAVLLLVSSLTLAASAQAAPHRATESPDEITKYWTKERMRSAIPRDAVRGGNPQAARKPGGGGTTTTWTRVAVDPIAGPDRNNGKVFFTIGGANYVCSGTSVATATASLVWTAGHCVTDGPNAFATKFTFVPAYRDGQAPYGKWAFNALDSTEEWENSGDFEHDFGAARVVPGEGAPPNTTLAQTVTTPRQMDFDYGVTSSTRFTSFGYPAATPFNGQRLYKCDSPVLRRDGSAMGIGCDMTGGSSGGGWLNAAGEVSSVNSYHYRSLKNVMFGPYQSGSAQALYISMQ